MTEEVFGFWQKFILVWNSSLRKNARSYTVYIFVLCSLLYKPAKTYVLSLQSVRRGKVAERQSTT